MCMCHPRLEDKAKRCVLHGRPSSVGRWWGGSPPKGRERPCARVGQACDWSRCGRVDSYVDVKDCGRGKNVRKELAAERAEVNHGAARIRAAARVVLLPMPG